jgi:YVTN family beta-propeller protein
VPTGRTVTIESRAAPPPKTSVRPATDAAAASWSGAASEPAETIRRPPEAISVTPAVETSPLSSPPIASTESPRSTAASPENAAGSRRGARRATSRFGGAGHGAGRPVLVFDAGDPVPELDPPPRFATTMTTATIAATRTPRRARPGRRERLRSRLATSCILSWVPSTTHSRVALAFLAATLLAGCGSSQSDRSTSTRAKAPTTTQTTAAAKPPKYAVPPLPNPHNVYAADRPGLFAPAVRKFPLRVYVPNSESNTVSVIDPKTYKVIDTFPVGALPQHVVPSYDLKTLWVTNDEGNTLTPIDPATGKPGKPVPVTDPYNLYFTPGGHYAMVIAERLERIDFRDAQTMRLHHSLKVPCPGVDHLDFTASGRYAVASCEFGGSLIKIDVRREKVVSSLQLPGGAMPQDVKLSPDGRIFYVADMSANGIWEIDARRFRKVGFIPTGAGAHGLYVSRDTHDLYVSNRGEGSISVVSFKKRKAIAKWRLPGGGSPDMGGVSPDGRVLWLSGRYNAQVYAIDTRTGKLLARIPVGSGPHGLTVYPQPGRYSLGHTCGLR